ncbi:MAG: hypothetical protein JRN65_00385 [Nitrososphaerota archaeon]|jgi:hypothetical protein|nr:hypothetical protein [Nitrososphaerota archaeon]
MDESRFNTCLLVVKVPGRTKIVAIGDEVAGLRSEDGGPGIAELSSWRVQTDYVPAESLDHLVFRMDDLYEAPRPLQRQDILPCWMYGQKRAGGLSRISKGSMSSSSHRLRTKAPAFP